MRSEQTDVPIKNLLKQVYAAHTAKVKCLEDEIEGLKNKLFEAEKKLKERDSDCKRCVELEEAFTSCKAALEEQTKWFENFGQKFSIFNSSENKISSKTSKVQDDIVQIHNESSFGSDIPQSNETNEKSSITKKNFLKNLLNLTPDKVQDSLDLCTVPFPGNLGPSCSSLNFDSVILAPDTADISLNAQSKVLKPSVNKPKVLKSSEQLNDITDKSKGSTQRHKSSKKRTCSNSSESETSPNKKFSKGIRSDFPNEMKILANEIVKKKESLVEEDIISDLAKNSNVKVSNDKTIDIFDLKASKNNAPVCGDDSKEKMVSIFHPEISKDINIEDSVKISKTEKEKSCRTKLEHLNSKDSMHQVSPSLLPLNKKNEKTILQKPQLAEDINDFQVSAINKNPPEMADAWKSCDKKKIKKGPNIKNIKVTSKFKMSLDTLPPNYKKPNLRQTKLSKSIFQPKNSAPENYFSNGAKKILSDSSNSSADSSKKNSPVNKSKKTNTIDFDATCIPENYKYNAESCEDDDDESILLIQDESSNESLHSPVVSPKIKTKSISKEDASKENKKKDNSLSCKKQVDNEHLSSFDRLPKREEPNYKYKEETVRKKSERKQLNGFECKECEKYFSDLGLSEEEKRERLNKCSRHRAKFPPPATPEHFWELDFPDTQECKARGYLNETQKVTLKTHRRRPL